MVRGIVIGGGLTLGLLLLAAAVVSSRLSRPLYDETLDPATLASVTIADPSQALTFARYRQNGELRALLVTQYDNDRLRGFDLQQQLGTDDSDPVSLFARLGYEALLNLARSGRAQVEVPTSALDVPFDARPDNIAIGANYLEHAREAQVEETPFVFPKLVQPTRFDAEVPRRDAWRLDYEAELGFVALEDLTPQSRPQTLGLVLGNDFTDRASLVFNLRPGEMGTRGFVEGKSREGFAPVGNLLVIPQDLETFYREVELTLYVNGRLRQRDTAGSMLWGPQTMLDEIFRREAWRFRRYGDTVPLLPAPGSIPQGTVIFSGTPAGVIFRLHNLWNPAAYLRPGDEVILRSDTLGVLRNRIVE